MPERESVHRVGGPGDGMTIDVSEGQDCVRVLLLTSAGRLVRLTIDDHPRGNVMGGVVGAGTYARTEWAQDGKVVFRFRGP